ncbi:hypothetical protein K2X92_01680 [Candidatus Gracilibacteria bacterium]|nr:hypothetical protein [Candidatus Gracilibacteria bacterium]
MEQIPIDFEQPNGSITTPVVQVNHKVQTIVEKVTTNKAFTYDEGFVVGKNKYHFRMSSRFKNGTYKLDKKTNKVRYLYFVIKDRDFEYQFDVWIADYSIINGSIEAKRYHDETLGDQVGNIHFSAIKKLDSRNGGAKFVNQYGENIQSFDYFNYLFQQPGPSRSLLPISRSLLPIIRNVILNIREKHMYNEGK